MLKNCIVLLLVFAMITGLEAKAQMSSGEILKMMHDRYYHKSCKTYSFSQLNTHYANDTVSGKSTWHEWVSFPDQFTIYFGDSAKGNYVHFRNDSAYRYRNKELLRASADSNILLLLIGGMYYRQLEDVSARLKKHGYDPSKFSIQQWENKKVFVYGADRNDSLSNQFWIDPETFVIVRIREKMRTGGYMDMRFGSHRKLCEGYVETRVSFRRNGHLEQVEEYFDIRSADR